MQKKGKFRRLRRGVLSVLRNPITYICIAFPCLMVLMIDITFRYEGGVTMESMGDSFWNFLIAFVAGYYDICVVTPVGRFCSFVILMSGILVFSTITAKIASILMERQNKRNKGLAKLKKIGGHFLICGWRNGFEKILDTVLASNPDIEPDMIVLVNDAPSEQVEQLRSLPKFKELKYISGDFSEGDTLERAFVRGAERALIISDNATARTQLETDSRTVLAVLTMKNLNPRLYVAAELFDSKFESHLHLAHCDEVILTTNYEYSLLATASSGMGYSNVISELIGDDADSGILIEDIPQRYIGKTYGELKAAFTSSEKGRNSLLIGLLLNTGNFYQRRKDALRAAQKNPDMKKIVGELQKVKTMKSNEPVFAPEDSLVVAAYSKAIFVKGKAGGAYGEARL